MLVNVVLTMRFFEALRIYGKEKGPPALPQTADKPVDIFGGFFLFRDDDVLLWSFTMLDGR
ncbi:hypothetical protein KHC17_21715 [Agrobacterium salinitolerans]|uniref:hypothetical protein n=1 Tax=Agrobacterium salinitolerans TaxID=1183413 RepID=UPI0010CA7A97|nr:hypothetical protein [Agrobacterium salinitolerans]QXC50436.1 hypothetical protein KHC17_21715 [Agrobacterium salinitolerans]